MMRFSDESELENIKKLLKDSMRGLGKWKESIFVEQVHSQKSKKGKGRRN